MRTDIDPNTPCPRILAEANSARAKAAAAVEAQWIMDLGDLSEYDLPPHVRQAAELRRHHPELSYRQLADQMGITKDAFAGLLRRFRERVHRQSGPAPYPLPTIAEVASETAKALAHSEAQWIADLGDLSEYSLTPRVRLAAELRRDHPDLTYEQLANQMGITLRAYMSLLRRLRVSGRRPTLAQRIAELGDLSEYALTPRVRLAAELRRDHPDLTREQLANRMGVTYGAYERMLRRFRVSVRRPSLAQRIAELGDLSEYALTPRVRLAAELRRDHPDLTYEQLANQMGITLTAYTSLLGRFPAAVGWTDVDRKRARSQHAPAALPPAFAAEAQRIAKLGNLSEYALDPNVRQAAELRRDHPDLTYEQLANQMGLTKDAYMKLLGRFWARRPDASRHSQHAEAAARWIAGLGELTSYPISPAARRAAELRRDYPELTQMQLAKRMGVSRNTYASLLKTFRRTVTGELEALRKPPLPRRVEDLAEMAQRIEARGLAAQRAAG
ncbi:helix-turn-helix domain-containing protein [Mycolicibacterium wolinskyi]|nr:helix-turn-helix domain-containing protein [Mycolicibacterium wolinskyi]